MGESVKKKIILSCVNFTEGGPLSIIYDCLDSQNIRDPEVEVIVLVHKKELFTKYLNDFTFLEFPEVKSSWKKRISFEYVVSKQLSITLKPDIWIALHDITPNVICPVQLVYCHNPSPFYRTKLSDVLLDYKFFLFSIFYKHLYRINIKKNKYVIVQQNWLRKEFSARYQVKTIVAYPSLSLPVVLDKKTKSAQKFIFLYPAFPRTFKNFETLFKAGIELSSFRQDFQILVTIDETQNKYSKSLYDAYKNYDYIKFIGKRSRLEMNDLYADADCLVFPSKLETWGLPLSEFKDYNKPMLVADLDYAHETVGNYSQVKFFSAEDYHSLSSIMKRLMDKNLSFDTNLISRPEEPFFTDWNSLLRFVNQIEH